MGDDAAVREERERTAMTWEALVDNGVQQDSPIDVDTFFYARDEASAQSLAEVLRADGARVTVGSFRYRVRLFKKETAWSLESTTPVLATLSTLSEHTARMVRLSRQTGTEYDGWGAELIEG
jgi:hypothetical protein